MSDLHCAEEDVETLAKRLHVIAGRAHVLEMEAYGETRPRQTLLPPTSTTNATQVQTDDSQKC